MMILYNGVVRSMIPSAPVCQAIAIDGNRIVALGKDEDILSLAEIGTEKIDLRGRLVLPGFHDSHMHLLWTGDNMTMASLVTACSPEDVIRLMRSFIGNDHSLDWVEGVDLDDNEFSNEMSRGLLDQASFVKPIIISRKCKHVVYTNTAALQNLHPKSPMPKGVEVDDVGVPTGVFREDGIRWLREGMPTHTKEQMVNSILTIARDMTRFGITSVQSNDTGMGVHAQDILDVFSCIQESLPIRVYEEISADELARLPSLDVFDISHPFFSVGCVKIFADGGLGARTAFLREPYSDTIHSVGLQNYGQNELSEIVEYADALGLQTAIHAIGDGALAQALTAYERQRCVGRHRHRIIHCQIGSNDQYRRMKDLGLCADIQPAFTAADWKLIEQRVGETRSQTSYAWKTISSMGIPMGFGSDSPVEQYDPLWGIYCAVTRQDKNRMPEGGWLPREKMSMEEACRHYTAGSAYLAFQESIKGTLEVNKLADITVLSKDFFTSMTEEILDTKVDLTITDGEIVYRARE